MTGIVSVLIGTQVTHTVGLSRLLRLDALRPVPCATDTLRHSEKETANAGCVARPGEQLQLHRGDGSSEPELGERAERRAWEGLWDLGDKVTLEMGRSSPGSVGGERGGGGWSNKVPAHLSPTGGG